MGKYVYRLKRLRRCLCRGRILMKKIDLGNKCVHCKKDTSMGSGRFVNRYPAEIEEEQADGSYIILDGYCCPVCEEEFYKEFDEVAEEAESREKKGV